MTPRIPREDRHVHRMTSWEAAGYGGLLGATISATLAAGGGPTGPAIVWLIIAIIAIASLSAAPNRGWLTRGLPVACAAVTAIAWAADATATIVQAAPCAACITICVATIRCARRHS